ncbi:hypothetical protein RFI_31440 [Reticulomyxa filosa]|uniref:Uncharacterized protein n=1 Tax=Reticulomyxa filosa TaxID=46433 RepID=X6LX91_RETFI|nr:hypothetical protein RFI_31440 [Reticulomyxa filosa]|eukprot:ETO05956.1 hypothetical protein RFI_31440 [Reticulomyxa filosa]
MLLKKSNQKKGNKTNFITIEIPDSSLLKSERRRRKGRTLYKLITSYCEQDKDKQHKQHRQSTADNQRSANAIEQNWYLLNDLFLHMDNNNMYALLKDYGLVCSYGQIMNKRQYKQGVPKKKKKASLDMWSEYESKLEMESKPKSEDGVINAMIGKANEVWAKIDIDEYLEQQMFHDRPNHNGEYL